MITHDGAPLAPWRKDEYLLQLPPTENVDTQRSVKLTLSNRSDHLVHVVDVSLSCGCMHGDLSADAIAPGASATYSLTMEVFRNEKQVDNSIMFTTDEAQGGYFIKIRGDLEKPLGGIPNEVTFLQTKPDAEPQVSEFTVEENTDHVAAVTGQVPGVNVERQRASDASVRIQLTLSDPTTTGNRGTITIESKAGRSYAVPVRVIAPPAASPRPVSPGSPRSPASDPGSAASE